MEIDLKIVDAIKNKDLNRINFFKQEIAKELRNKGIDIEKIDSLCEEILMEAVNGYTKETPIRFLFYIKKIINSKVSTLNCLPYSLCSTKFPIAFIVSPLFTKGIYPTIIFSSLLSISVATV